MWSRPYNKAAGNGKAVPLAFSYLVRIIPIKRTKLNHQNNTPNKTKKNIKATKTAKKMYSYFAVANFTLRPKIFSL